jgi:hypothetical protein
MVLDSSHRAPAPLDNDSLDDTAAWQQLSALRERLGLLVSRARAVEEALTSAACAVAAGEPTDVDLKEPLAWLDEARQLLAEVSAAVRSDCARLSDAEGLVVARQRELEAAAEQARLRAEQELADARRATVEDFVRRLRELGISDPAEIMQAIAAAGADHETPLGGVDEADEPTGSPQADIRPGAETEPGEGAESFASGGSAVHDAAGAPDSVFSATEAPVPATAAISSEDVPYVGGSPTCSPDARTVGEVVGAAPVGPDASKGFAGSAEVPDAARTSLRADHVTSSDAVDQQVDLVNAVTQTGDSRSDRVDVGVEVASTAGAGDPGTPTVGDGKIFADLVAKGREDLAWAVAEATGQPRSRQRALGLFAAAMACDPARLEASLSAILPEEVPETADESRLLLAASLRFGLSSGYSPLSLPRLLERAEIRHEPTRVLVMTAIDAVQRGGRRPAAGGGAGYDELLKQWAAIADRAQALLSTLRTRVITFHRAKVVLHHLARDREPLGQALVDLAALSEAGPDIVHGDPRFAQLAEFVEALGEPRGVSALITAADKAVSSPFQLLKPIQASARRRLESSIEEVRQLVSEALVLGAQMRQADRSADLSELDQLRRAGANYVAPPDLQTVGEHALHRLATWVREDPAPVGSHTLDSLRRHALRYVFEIDRDADGAPVGELRPEHLGPVLAGRSGQDAVAGHLERGNVEAARALLSDVGAEQAERLDEQCSRASERLGREHAAIVKKAEAAIAKLRSVGLDEPARELEQRLDTLRKAPPDRYDLRRGPLAALIQRADEELGQYRHRLVSRLGTLAAGDADSARIHTLLDRGDEVTAEEFVTLLASGHELPPEVDARLRGDFDEFFPAVVEQAVAAASPAGQHGELDTLDALVRSLGQGEPTAGILRDGLNAWRTLRNPHHQRRRGDEFRRALADVMRMLGLLPTSNNFADQTDDPRARTIIYEVRARPMDRSYVPQFGTQANGKYSVILMFERATPSRLLELVSERRRTRANLILYFGTLSVEQRLQLRQLSVAAPGKGSATLVIDEPVVGWLVTREEPGFRLLQRVTLPFTAINPYTPFAGGDVPSEMFVGRDKERADVESPTGSMFVYGGRQLGKSALLRRIEKLFTDTPGPDGQRHQVALYLDLKSESIGEARSTEELWNALIRSLKELGVLPEASRPNAGPDRVVRWIREWLSRDEANRLLLLLDEADMFLAADAKPNDAGGGQFRTLQRLKSLMESSDRRFKPVFAGLHQVQRFHDSPNTPVAHGGADILIGPLRPAEVRKLVVDPMRAMGYGFESDELVWRIAALTNYQASLVQIFCEALVDHLRSRVVKRPGRTLVTSDDVDGVYADRRVRELIAQRFRWTINLDARYRVIALVVALLSSGSEADAVFSAEDLREYCSISWPEAFSGNILMLKEFMGYLDELVGLGVLHRTGERYGIRSPNVVALLGTRSSLDQELREAPEHFELPYEYNPKLSRIPLGTGAEAAAAQRSPLTDDDLANLIGERGTSPAGISKVRRAGANYQLAVVTGTPALGIARVARALTMVAARQDLNLEPVGLNEVRRRLGDKERTHRHFLMEVDHRQEPLLSDRLTELIKLIDGRKIVRAIAVVHVSAAQMLELPDDDAVLQVPLHRWSVEGLRAWHDFPFDTPPLRQRVHQLTSGWPTLLEQAASQAAAGRSTEDVLDALRTPFGNPDMARAFLEATGLDDDAAIASARTWAATTSYPESLADLAAILGDLGTFLDRAAALDVAERQPTGWVLDPVVAAALRLVN